MSSAETRKRQHDLALNAARWLYETQKAELLQNPTRPRSSISSTRTAAERFGVSKSTVARQLTALKNGKPSATRIGRPNRLSDVEDQMLSFHMFMLRREKRPVSLKVVQDATDALLSRRNPPGHPISRCWAKRWLRTNRAQAREEAMLRSNGNGNDNGALPNPEPVEVEPDNDDDDLDGDAESDSEAAGLNLDPSF
ncbi:hypothetical protein F5Y12DRAFT_710618 [Xylaria sp. FL1777]|nr:hypothetical protein F5Y12DRAFT_710618 [Xylaria sp. FL1777]